MPAPAVEKVIEEGHCRLCTATDIETAHLWPQKRGARGYNDPDLCVPLCRHHHGQLDRHELELLPYLTLEEQVALVRAAGGIMLALNRVRKSVRF